MAATPASWATRRYTPKANAAARNTELSGKRCSSVGFGGSTPVSAAPASRRSLRRAFGFVT